MLLLLLALAAPQSPLLEAALKKRAEVERIRAAEGPAPRFAGYGNASDPAPVPEPPEVEEPEAAPVRASPDREEELRERLLDLEAALVSIGASGLPLPPRNPNRFHGALDAARIRAEIEDVREELRRY